MSVPAFLVGAALGVGITLALVGSPARDATAAEIASCEREAFAGLASFPPEGWPEASDPSDLTFMFWVEGGETARFRYNVINETERTITWESNAVYPAFYVVDAVTCETTWRAIANPGGILMSYEHRHEPGQAFADMWQEWEGTAYLSRDKEAPARHGRRYLAYVVHGFEGPDYAFSAWVSSPYLLEVRENGIGAVPLD